MGSKSILFREKLIDISISRVFFWDYNSKITQGDAQERKSTQIFMNESFPKLKYLRITRYFNKPFPRILMIYDQRSLIPWISDET